MLPTVPVTLRRARRQPPTTRSWHYRSVSHPTILGCTGAWQSGTHRVLSLRCISGRLYPLGPPQKVPSREERRASVVRVRANHASIDLHPWTSKTTDYKKPTYALIDIDPGDKTSVWFDADLAFEICHVLLPDSERRRTIVQRIERVDQMQSNARI